MIILDNLRYKPYEDQKGSYTLHQYTLKVLLGLDPKRHLPKEGLGPQMVGNVEVWVTPAGPYKGHKSSTHRVLCKCPKCGETMSAGRLHQHMPIHK